MIQIFWSYVFTLAEADRVCLQRWVPKLSIFPCTKTKFLPFLDQLAKMTFDFHLTCLLFPFFHLSLTCENWKNIGDRCYLCSISIGKNVHSFLQGRKQGCNGICIPNLKKQCLQKVPSYWISACICVTEVPKLRKWCFLKIEQSFHLGRYIRHGGVWWNTRQSNKEKISWRRQLLRIRNVNSWIKKIKFIMFFKVRWKDVWAK